MVKPIKNELHDDLFGIPAPLDMISVLKKFRGKKILVVGEGILDSYLYGISQQLCREAPVPVISLLDTKLSAGGAANTAVSLALLGADVTFMTILGNDPEGDELRRILKSYGIHTENIFLNPERSTIFKQRIISGNQLLIRIDKGTKDPIKGEQCARFSERLKEIIGEFDSMIVSDYMSGLLTPQLIEGIVSMIKSAGIITALDARSLSPYLGSGFYIIKPNYIEAVNLLGIPEAHGSERVKQIISHGQTILKKTKASIAAVTLDADGAVIFEKDHRPYRIYARPLAHPNTAGAGDTFISAFVLSLASKTNSSVAAEIASFAAAIAIGKKEATVTCSNQELIGFLTKKNKEITSLAELADLKAFYASQGFKIIFTNGCFDILHRGHIYFLNQCKSLGDILIVGVNNDESIRLIKGQNRPLNRLSDRLQILQSLSCVNHVIGFHGPAPLEIIRVLKPHIFVKGSNHHIDCLPEVPVIRQQGGEICLLPYLNEYSTEGIIERVKTSMQN
ncbi:MAG: PfkB family carbohydrate kinase [Candidatus Omnitrophota bacterium]